MTNAEKEKLISRNMEILQISREEAEQLIADDEAIDKGAKLFELTADQKQASKQARSTGTKTTNPATPRAKREKKADSEKGMLISAFSSALENLAEVDKIDITNAEREIVFFCNGRKFKVVLSAPRS